MMNKKDIVISNARLGIKTVFFDENNGLFGYTENGAVYLNEYYDEDLDMINKHEVLHFFEDSKQFCDVKNILFNMLGEKELNRLRNEYYLKYSGLYSEKEINNGVLDNEITIDMIVGNGVFSLPVNDYIDNAYESIVSKKSSIKLTKEGKRYLSLNVSKNISNRYNQLSKWDLLFAGMYYEGKDKPKGETKYVEIGVDAIDACEKLLYGTNYNYFFINYDDNPYLERRFNEIIETYKSKGDYEEVNQLLENKSKSLYELSYEYSSNIKGQFLSLFKLLRDSDYEHSFKYLIMNEALNKTYRYEQGNRIVDKREKGKTILPIMLINEFILKEIHDNIDKYSNFTDLYFDSLDKYNTEFLKKRNVNFNKSEKGCWIKFDKGEAGTISFIKDSQDLTNLIRNTPWCTKNSTEEQLKQGDFYVFVDNFGKPRIAVQLKGDYLNEVRGIKGGYDQEIEDEYRQIAIDFLKENISIVGAKGWLGKEERNQLLEEILIKMRTKTLNESDIETLVKLLNVKEALVHGNVNSNEKKLIREISNNKEIRDKIFIYSKEAKRVLKIIDEIERNHRILDYQKKLECDSLKMEECKYLYNDLLYSFDKWEYTRDQKELIKIVNGKKNVFKQFIANKYLCSQEEIFIGRLERNNIPLKDGICPLKVVLGDVELIGLKNADLSNLSFIKGNLEMTDSSKIDFSSLEKVDGQVVLTDNNSINMSSLEEVNGNLKVSILMDSDLSGIRRVNGNAMFGFYGGVKEYKNLEEVNGNLKINHITEKMDNLRFVKGVIEWDNSCKIIDFPSLETCGGFDGVPDNIKLKYNYDDEKQCYLKKEMVR